MSSQLPMGGHLAIPLNSILYTNVLPISSHLRLKATFSVSQGWLLIAGSAVLYNNVTWVVEKPALVAHKKAIFHTIQWN